jgi:hypothetical protein
MKIKPPVMVDQITRELLCALEQPPGLKLGPEF